MSRSFVGNSGRGAVVVIFTTVLGGCALMAAAGLIAQSALQLSVRAERLKGADVVVSAPQTLHQDADLAVALPERAVVPASLTARLAALPSVTTAVGDLSFPAAVPGTHVEGPEGAGHGWSSVNLLDHPRITGTAPTGSQQVAVHVGASGRWRPGEPVNAVLAGHSIHLTITAVVRGACASGRICGLYVPDRVAAQLAGRLTGVKHDTVDLVALKTTGNPDALAAQVRRHVGNRYVISSGNHVGEAEVLGAHAARGFLLVLASSFSGVMLLIVGFAVAGALAVSVSGQRRDLALLGVVGATPRQLRKVIARQAMGATLLAIAPGVGLGYMIADRFGDLLADRGLIPAQLVLASGPLPGAAAAVLIALTVRGAAWVISLSPSRLAPSEALAAGDVDPPRPAGRRFSAGLLLIVAAVPIAAVPVISDAQDRAAGTAIAGLVEVIGFALAGPGLLHAFSGAAVTHAPSRLPVMVWTAMSNIREHALRSAGAISALAMVMVFTLTSVMSNTTVEAAAQREVRAGAATDVAYTAPSLGGLPVDLIRYLRDQPHVKAAVGVTSTTLLLPHRESDQDRIDAVPALAAGPDVADVLDLEVTAGTLAGLTGPTIAMKQGLAPLGATMNVILGDGTRTEAKVVATYRRALGFGPVLASKDLVEGHTSTGLAGIALVALEAGAPAPPAPLGVEQGAASSHLGARTANAQSWVNLAVLAVLLGYVLISVANRLVVTMTRRRTELLALHRIGATRRQLLRMVRVEALLMAACAVAAALLLAAVPLGLVGVGYLNRPWPAGPAWLVPALGVLVTAISWTAYEAPARRLLRSSLV